MITATSSNMLGLDLNTWTAIAAVVGAVSTLVLAIITFFQMRKTEAALRESKNLRKDARLPILEPKECYIHYTTTTLPMAQNKRGLHVRLENIGYGPALNLRATIPGSDRVFRGNNTAQEAGTWIHADLNDAELERLISIPNDRRSIYINYDDVFGREVRTWILCGMNPDENTQTLYPDMSNWHLLIPDEETSGLLMPPSLTDALLDSKR